MLNHPIFMTFGLLVISMVGYTQYRGLGNISVNEVKAVPKSVRDNPGSYRSHYAGYPRYLGGK
ncbi:MAG: hypothetical protein JJE04_03715 [Acidobacteriia bacterium]|nr:hypothetical protein [Terriglobia bacterium]